MLSSCSIYKQPYLSENNLFEISTDPGFSEVVFIEEIPIDDISPIDIVAQDDFLWLSDVDNNRVVKIDLDGKNIEEYSGFQHPIHIAIQGSKIYIPEYTSDTLSILENGTITTFPLKEIPLE